MSEFEEEPLCTECGGITHGEYIPCPATEAKEHKFARLTKRTRDLSFFDDMDEAYEGLKSLPDPIALLLPPDPLDDKWWQP